MKWSSNQKKISWPKIVFKICWEIAFCRMQTDFWQRIRCSILFLLWCGESVFFCQEWFQFGLKFLYNLKRQANYSIKKANPSCIFQIFKIRNASSRKMIHFVAFYGKKYFLYFWFLNQKQSDIGEKNLGSSVSIRKQLSFNFFLL